MKLILLLFLLLTYAATLSAQTKYLFMRDALYQDSNYCAFLLKPGNNLLIGQIIDIKAVNQQLADSLELVSFVFPVGLDSNKIVGFKVKNMALEFNDTETIERWGTSRNKTYIKPSALNRRYRSKVNSTIIGVNENGTVMRDLQPIYERRTSQSMQNYTRAINFDNVKYDQYYFYSNDSTLFCFNPSLTKIIAYDYLGNLLAKTKINIEKPAVYSNKSKYLLQDKSKDDFYLIVQTNFSFNIYRLNLINGKATFLESLAGVWEEPTWRIENGNLTYVRESKTYEVDLTKKGTQ